MVDVILSVAAEKDLETIDEYTFVRFGADMADEYTFGFQTAFDLLSRHPMVGELKTKLGEAIRCFVHRHHRIFYRFADDLVLVVRIVHHAQTRNRR